MDKTALKTQQQQQQKDGESQQLKAGQNSSIFQSSKQEWSCLISLEEIENFGATTELVLPN